MGICIISSRLENISSVWTNLTCDRLPITRPDLRRRPLTRTAGNRHIRREMYFSPFLLPALSAWADAELNPLPADSRLYFYRPCFPEFAQVVEVSRWLIRPVIHSRHPTGTPVCFRITFTSSLCFVMFFWSTRPGCSPMERRLNCHNVVYYRYSEAWAFCPCCWATMLHYWCACCWCVYYVGFFGVCVCVFPECGEGSWFFLLFFKNATKPANVYLNCDLSRCREMTAETRSSAILCF